MKYIISLLIISNYLYSAKIHDTWLDLNSQHSFDTSKQSYCFKIKDSTLNNNLKLSVRPASVSKLYTSLWALETLGRNFRFTTEFLVKDNTLYIKGSKDPFFVSENLLAVIGEIQTEIQLTSVVYDQNFYFNWSKNIDSINLSLAKILNSDNWSSIFIDTVKDLESYILRYSYNYHIPYVINVSNILFQEKINLDSFDKKFTHKSSPLLMHLKQVNIYSNNFYSDSLFDQLGSSKEFHKFLYSKFNIDSKDTFFFTGSGLGENRTTCATTLNVLDALKKYSQSNKFDLTELVSVAGTDAGTLRNRFNKTLNKSVLAKTGTLRHTSTLAGYLGENKSISFAIFNHSFETQKARKLQDKFLLEFSKIYSFNPLDYTRSKYLSISKTEIKKETH